MNDNNHAPVTRPDLDAIRARAEAATGGPWKLWGMAVMADRKGTGYVDQSDDIAITTDPDRGNRTFNAQFIAHAREDIPDLLTALAAERARVDQMVPREQYDRQLGRLADDSRRHLTRARAAEQEAAAQRARAYQAERDVKRYEERARENRELLDQLAAQADQAEQRIAAAIAIAAGAGDMNWEEDNYAAGAQHVAAALSPTALSSAPIAEYP